MASSLDIGVLVVVAHVHLDAEPLLDPVHERSDRPISPETTTPSPSWRIRATSRSPSIPALVRVRDQHERLVHADVVLRECLHELVAVSSPPRTSVIAWIFWAKSICRPRGRSRWCSVFIR